MKSEIMWLDWFVLLIDLIGRVLIAVTILFIIEVNNLVPEEGIKTISFIMILWIIVPTICFINIMNIVSDLENAKPNKSRKS